MRALRLCDNPWCHRECDKWERYAGAGFINDSPEHFWWDVFDDLLERMCRAREKASR